MRKVSKNALALACDTAELKIREELAQKIAQIRKEWDFVGGLSMFFLFKDSKDGGILDIQ